jgi:hypothetical protein
LADDCIASKVIYFGGINQNVDSRDEFFFKVKVERFFNLHRSTHFARTRENINESRLLLTFEIKMSIKETSFDIDFYY